MSLFSTKIQVDLAQVLSLLPKGSFVHRVTYADAVVTIHWESEKYATGLTVPVEFPVNDLKRHIPPKGIRKPGQDIAPVEKPEPPKPEPVPAPEPPKPDPIIRSQEKFDAAVAEGKKLEYWGIEAIWKDLDELVPGFEQGNLYRVAPEAPQQIVVDSAVATA